MHITTVIVVAVAFLHCTKTVTSIRADPSRLNLSSLGEVAVVSSEVHSGGDCPLLALPIGDFCITEKKLPANGELVARGYERGGSGDGTAEGYLQGSRFFGMLRTRRGTYYLEPAARFRSELNSSDPEAAVLYGGSEIESRLWDNCSWLIPGGRVEHLQSVRVRTREPRTGAKTGGRVCTVAVVADPLFVNEMGGGKAAAAAMRLLTEEASAILRNADWNDDGQPDNIGLSVRYVVTLSEGDPRDRFKTLPVNTRNNTVDSREYLLTFATNVGLLRKVCLGLVFTARQFEFYVLGVSFTAPPGGVCERPLSRDTVGMNVVAVTTRTSRGPVPFALQVLALAHETAHSFGAPHDGEYSSYDKVRCAGGQYIMSPISVNATHPDHFRFSKCSREPVNRLLRRRWHCLEPDQQPFCGNGVLERGEECDCGLSVWCRSRDDCCVPRGFGPSSCDIDRSAGLACHPHSHGACCGPDCQLANLSSKGIDCWSWGPVESWCPCQQGVQPCPCGLLGGCVGAECHSRECAALGLPECQCPAQKNHCATCCLVAGGDCLPADKIAEYLLLHSNITLEQVSWGASRVQPAAGASVNRLLCRADGRCKRMWFRRWPLGAPCVTRGSVGYCYSDGCILKHDSLMQPRIVFRQPDTASTLRSASTAITLCTVLSLINYYCN